jgi:hypothetical protein
VRRDVKPKTRPVVQHLNVTNNAIRKPDPGPFQLFIRDPLSLGVGQHPLDASN